MTIDDEKYKELIKHLSETFSLNKNQKIAILLGILSLICGGLICFFLFIFGDALLPDAVFVALLALAAWFFGYGFSAYITRRAIYSLYYPTVTILMIASLPAIAAAITFRYQEWIEILSVCLCAASSLIIWTIFLWQTFVKPAKAKQKFISDHANDISEDDINSTIVNNIESVIAHILKNEKGDIAIIAQEHGMRQNVAVYKNDDGIIKLHSKQSFVEVYSAKYYAYEKLLSFLEEERTIYDKTFKF